MRYALVNNERREAEPKIRGICPVCGQPVIAKCGEYKINHWAHVAHADCDKWWETETEWHRAWKNNFASEWQEQIMHDNKTGEKHVADILAPDGLVIEFQHSAIKPEERRSREAFYKEMVWVVDGTRCPSDIIRFFKEPNNQLVNSVYFECCEEAFPRNWRNCTVPVIMDFGTPPGTPDYLYCLLPEREIFVRILRQDFIKKVKEETWQASIKNATGHLNAFYKRKKAEEDRREALRVRFYEIRDYKHMRAKFCDTYGIENKRGPIIKNNQRTNTDMAYEVFEADVVELIKTRWCLFDEYDAREFVLEERLALKQMFKQGATPEIAAQVLTDPNL